jgi:hypothetical protein
MKNLIEAAWPFAEESVGEDFPCHLGICPIEKCGRCSRILTLRRAIEEAERATPHPSTSSSERRGEE